MVGNCAAGNTPPTYPVAIADPIATALCTPQCLPLWLLPTGVPDETDDEVTEFATVSAFAWDIQDNQGSRFINCVGTVNFLTTSVHAFEFDFEGDPTNAKVQAIENAAWGQLATRTMYWVHRDERNRQFSGVGDIFIAGKRTDENDMGGYRFRLVNRGRITPTFPTVTP